RLGRPAVLRSEPADDPPLHGIVAGHRLADDVLAPPAPAPRHDQAVAVHEPAQLGLPRMKARAPHARGHRVGPGKRDGSRKDAHGGLQSAMSMARWAAVPPGRMILLSCGISLPSFTCATVSSVAARKRVAISRSIPRSSNLAKISSTKRSAS